jgi:hypothetical protein
MNNHHHNELIYYNQHRQSPETGYRTQHEHLGPPVDLGRLLRIEVGKRLLEAR